MSDPTVDLATDFATVNDAGLLRARRDWFAPSSTIEVGAVLNVGDADDALWTARVVTADTTWVELELLRPIDDASLNEVSVDQVLPAARPRPAL